MLAPRSFLFTSSNPRISKASNPTPPEKLSRSSPSHTSTTTSSALDKSSLSSYESGNTTSQTPSVIMANTKVLSSDPVVIPVRNTKSRDGKPTKRSNSSRDSSRYGPRIHQAKNEMPPAVAALLASTAIPRPRARRQSIKRNEQYQRLTVDAVLHHNSKKDYTSSERSPLDLLLSPPDELDDVEDSDTGSPSYMTCTTMSSVSTPSLVDSSSGEASPSPGFPLTPSFRARRRVTPTRKQDRSPANSPPLETVTDHPLSDLIDVEELDFRVFTHSETDEDKEDEAPAPKPKSAFKSNLTASLRALRSAATALSNLAAPTIRPDDFLTRSIMTLDPRVPFTDERMPPRLEDTPTPALRRYLNPTTNAPISAHVPHSLIQTSAPHNITASIQLQTYKVSVSAKSIKSAPAIPKRSSSSSSTISAEQKIHDVASGPVARQRDMRENSDFIRVAVMEMLMRRNGKLADNVPGRARWALPPRKMGGREYVVREGVPERWIGISAD